MSPLFIAPTGHFLLNVKILACTESDVIVTNNVNLNNVYNRISVCRVEREQMN